MDAMGESTTLDDAASRVLADYRQLRWRLALVEASTGGLTAASLAGISGASAVLERALVPYSNEAKEALLGIPTELFLAHGAVSAEVALAMAEGMLAHSPAEVALAETGIAGPGGGSPQKPVGLVFLALARRDAETQVERHLFAGSRQEVQRATAAAALALLRSATAG